MRILAVDIGTGTQDVLLFDSSQLVENCVQMIMPSPTRIIAGRINQATAKGRSVFLSGVTMGGGPNNGALARHLATGLAAYATEAAALTFNDNLEAVRAMGVTILAGDEKPPLGEFEFIELKDLDLVAIRQAFQAFGVEGEFDAVAVAVLRRSVVHSAVRATVTSVESRDCAITTLSGRRCRTVLRMQTNRHMLGCSGPLGWPWTPIPHILFT